MKPNSGEYKLMGLAPFGQPKYLKLMKENLLKLKNGSHEFTLNSDFIKLDETAEQNNLRLEKLFGVTQSKNEELTQAHADIAASAQKLLTEAVLEMVKYAQSCSDSKNLVLAGGVALNCVTNSEISKSGLFEKIWVFPAAGDAGASSRRSFSILLKAGQFYKKNNLVLSLFREKFYCQRNSLIFRRDGSKM